MSQARYEMHIKSGSMGFRRSDYPNDVGYVLRLYKHKDDDIWIPTDLCIHPMYLEDLKQLATITINRIERNKRNRKK